MFDLSFKTIETLYTQHPASFTMGIVGVILLFLLFTRQVVVEKVKSNNNIYKKNFLDIALLILANGLIITGIAAYMDSLDITLLGKSLAAALVISLIVHRVTTHNFASQLFIIMIWIAAIVYGFGFFDQTYKWLNEAQFSMGKVNFSLLNFIKVYFILSLMVWLVLRIQALTEKRFYSAESLTPSQKVLYVKLFKFTLYLIVGLIVFNISGIDTTSLTVISGAIAFGIGFGLQKVFSNLISGIILLVDKSIKPGDVIAIDETFGVVTQLEARYVSIVTRDGKKHLVPNETLVTEKVENWSFQDEELRLSIFVSASYDDDPYLVERILSESAQAHRRVLAEKKPFGLLKDFGDSGITYELRFWINDPQNGIGKVKSDIRFEIFKRFKDEGITIPYPIREVLLPEDLEDTIKDIKSLKKPPKKT